MTIEKHEKPNRIAGWAFHVQNVVIYEITPAV